MQWKTNFVLAAGTGVLLVSCGVFDSGTGAAVAQQRPPREQLKLAVQSVDDAPLADGQPKQTSTEQVSYDEVGYASWYGEELSGNKTANGEIFAPGGISAAHPTLPMPSFVEVTNLDSGRTILVRINDRGPFKKGRIIDLSRGAAEQLGVTAQGNFPVRVRRVNPPEFERRQLQGGGQATERLATPPSLLAALRRNLSASGAAPTVAAKPNKPLPNARSSSTPPAPVVASAAGVDFDAPGAPMKPKPVAKPNVAVVAPAPTPVASDAGNYFVQIGAFSSEARAAAFARSAKAQVVSAGSLWRVRTGPYADEASARAALGPLAAKGYRDARVTR
jgi:rare lipoprotein A